MSEVSEAFRRYVTSSGVDFDALTVEQKREWRKDFELVGQKPTAGGPAGSPAVRDNRMQKIVNSLKKRHYNISSPDVISVLEHLARHDRNLEVGSVNTDLAEITYKNVRDAAGTETKSCIGTKINMKVNGPVFDEFPFISSARNSAGALRLVKILRVPEGSLALSTRQLDLQYETESVKFVHHAIVPMEYNTITIDLETARSANCRVGENHILIMPWYTSTLNKLPSNDLLWIAREGKRILEALQYLHSQGYVHLDVKATNVFVDHNANCFLGDFGSCKPIGLPITSCTTAFCLEDNRGKPAHPKYDYFMFLLMVLIECLEDRRTYTTDFYEANSRYASESKVLAAAQAMTTPPELVELLTEVLDQIFGFQRA